MNRTVWALGRRALLAVSWIALLAALFAGCASSGNPFELEANPVLSITRVSPPDGAIGVNPDTLVTIAFPLDMDARTISRSTVHLQIADLGNVLATEQPEPRRRGVSARVIYESASRIISIIPDEPLAPSTTYEVVLQDVRSTGDVLFNTLVARFSTGVDARTPPAVLAIRPFPDQTSVTNRTPVVITFSKVMDQASLLRTVSVAPTVAGTVSFQVTTRTTMTFVPGDPYPTGGQVTVTVRPDASDLTGVAMGRSFVSKFSVLNSPFVDPTQVIPANGEVNVLRTSPVVLLFSTVMDEQSVKDATTLVIGSTVIGQGQGTFTFRTVFTPPQTEATFQPTTQFTANTTVEVRVDSLARSSTGLPLSPLFFSRFTTGN